VTKSRPVITLVKLSGGPFIDRAIEAFRACLATHHSVAVSEVVGTGGPNLVFGLAGRVSKGSWPHLPSSSIIVNWCPKTGNTLATLRHAEYLASYPVLEPNQSVVSLLRTQGNPRVEHLPVRFHEALRVVIPPRAKVLDVVFVGERSRRRSLAIDSCRQRGLLAAELDEVDTAGAIETLARARLAIAVRPSHTAPLDALQLAILIASGSSVLAECAAQRPDEESFAPCRFVPYDSIAEVASGLLQEDGWRALCSETGDSAVRYPALGDELLRLENFILELSATALREGTGNLLALRHAAAAGEPSVAFHFVNALDYCLGRHDRGYDVDDIFSHDEVSDHRIPLAVLAALHREKLSDYLHVRLGQWIVARAQADEYLALSEYGKLLTASALSKLGEIFLFLRVVEAAQDPVEVAKHSLGSHGFNGLAAFEAATEFLEQSKLAPSVKAQVAAEIHWALKQKSRAVDIYLTADARHYAACSPAHACVIAERLGEFGHRAACEMYAAMGSLGSQGLHPAVEVSSPGTSMLPTRPIEELATILERSPCYTGQRITWRNSEIVIGDRALGEALLLDGDLKIHDARFGEARSSSPVAAVAIIACFNEVDVIEAVVRSYLEQGIRTHVIDNWSTDGTWELLNLLKASLPELLLERFPTQGADGVYNWRGLLERKEEIALAYPNRWVLHTDADEIRCTPWDGIPLRQGFAIAERYGCNAIDFAVLHFRPVDEGFSAGINPQDYFRYYELGTSVDMKYQLKCWKQGLDRVDLASRGGHAVNFSNKRVFPIKFLCKHYPIRSRLHAERKIVSERLGRFSATERQLGWHSHYDNLDPAQCIWLPAALNRFTGVGQSALGYSLIHGF
jgi:hypothetical protein